MLPPRASTFLLLLLSVILIDCSPRGESWERERAVRDVNDHSGEEKPTTGEKYDRRYPSAGNENVHGGDDILGRLLDRIPQRIDKSIQIGHRKYYDEKISISLDNGHDSHTSRPSNATHEPIHPTKPATPSKPTVPMPTTTTVRSIVKPTLIPATSVVARMTDPTEVEEIGETEQSTMPESIPKLTEELEDSKNSEEAPEGWTDEGTDIESDELSGEDVALDRAEEPVEKPGESWQDMLQKLPGESWNETSTELPGGIPVKIAEDRKMKETSQASPDESEAWILGEKAEETSDDDKATKAEREDAVKRLLEVGAPGFGRQDIPNA